MGIGEWTGPCPFPTGRSQFDAVPFDSDQLTSCGNSSQLKAITKDDDWGAPDQRRTKRQLPFGVEAPPCGVIGKLSTDVRGTTVGVHPGEMIDVIGVRGWCQPMSTDVIGGVAVPGVIS